MVNNILLDRRATLTLLRLSSFTGLVSSNLLPTRYSLAHPFELQMGWSRRKHFVPVTNAMKDMLRSYGSMATVEIRFCIVLQHLQDIQRLR